uniref:Uncharacterized protein n=1 Tax=Ananas comosus var. bracteatus TaxID=296719 RepID=A0A6V7QML6_ANACO|nr:unnamed protein product [Ananas comosus var. bracteatus]
MVQVQAGKHATPKSPHRKLTRAHNQKASKAPASKERSSAPQLLFPNSRYRCPSSLELRASSDRCERPCGIGRSAARRAPAERRDPSPTAAHRRPSVVSLGLPAKLRLRTPSGGASGGASPDATGALATVTGGAQLERGRAPIPRVGEKKLGCCGYEKMEGANGSKGSWLLSLFPPLDGSGTPSKAGGLFALGHLKISPWKPGPLTPFGCVLLSASGGVILGSRVCQLAPGPCLGPTSWGLEFDKGGLERHRLSLGRDEFALWGAHGLVDTSGFGGSDCQGHECGEGEDLSSVLEAEWGDQSSVLEIQGLGQRSPSVPEAAYVWPWAGRLLSCSGP